MKGELGCWWFEKEESGGEEVRRRGGGISRGEVEELGGLEMGGMKGVV